MDFWEQQRRAKRETTIYIIIFFLMTAAVAAAAEFAMRMFAQEAYDPTFPLIGAAFASITFLAAAYNYLMYRSNGGGYVAESLGAMKVDPQTADPGLRQLVNVVEEMAVASSLPVPEIYLLDAPAINAFAAGLVAENSAICVTTGALRTLNRDELQGVIAHEFGHIYNRDMRITLILAALVMGFFVLIYIGLRILQFSSLSSREEEKKGNPVMLAALILIAAGAISWLGGAILRSCVSRQREYLADASAVQFTRNPNGILGALKKIEVESKQQMPAQGGAYAHMYFDHRSFWDFLFATHPPLSKRIEAIEGRKFEEANTENHTPPAL